MKRLLFWLSRKPFIYTGDGVGYVVLGYNPISDNLRVRTSQFGYVTSHTTMSRADYEAIRSAERSKSET